MISGTAFPYNGGIAGDEPLKKSGEPEVVDSSTRQSILRMDRLTEDQHN